MRSRALTTDERLGPPLHVLQAARGVVDSVWSKAILTCCYQHLLSRSVHRRIRSRIFGRVLKPDRYSWLAWHLQAVTAQHGLSVSSSWPSGSWHTSYGFSLYLRLAVRNVPKLLLVLSACAPVEATR